MSDKAVIQFKAVGSSLILKQSVYKVSTQQPWAKLILFLRRLLSLQDSEPLVNTYVQLQEYNFLQKSQVNDGP
jgi:hypothetical protein